MPGSLSACIYLWVITTTITFVRALCPMPGLAGAVLVSTGSTSQGLHVDGDARWCPLIALQLPGVPGVLP